MDIEEARKLVFRRLYEGAFLDGVKYEVTLREFAEERGIEREIIDRVYEELEAGGFFKRRWIGGNGIVVEPSVSALEYCEVYQLVDRKLLEKQEEIRNKILLALADADIEKISDPNIDEDEICRRGNINQQEFANNSPLLAYRNHIEKDHFYRWRITPGGREIVNDLRRKRAHLEEFEKLGDLIDMNRQARGLKFQKLLAEVIEDEGWKVKEGARPQGKENDIVITRDLINYFLVSCKWETEPIQVAVVEHLRSRAQGMVFSTGILVSMSGFTPNSIGEVLQGRTMKEIVLFGREDVGAVFLNEKKFTDLLYEKIERLKHVGKVLVDGISH